MIKEMYNFLSVSLLDKALQSLDFKKMIINAKTFQLLLLLPSLLSIAVCTNAQNTIKETANNVTQLSSNDMPAASNNNTAQLQHATTNTFTTHQVISYGQSFTTCGINLPVDEHTQWAIYENQTQLLKGEGNSIKDYLFLKPGNFTLKLFTPEIKLGNCNHGATDQTIELTVSNIKTNLNFDAEFWFQLFSNQKSFNAYEVTVPITISSYDAAAVSTIKDLKISVAGIDCNLIGIQKSPSNLLPGTHQIVFVLDGVVAKNIYAMLDFTNHTGLIQTQVITKQIN